MPLRPPFVGREEVVQRVRAMLERTPLVTLTGFGGVGKTTLALEVAVRTKGAVTVRLEEARTLDDVRDRICLALGLELTRPTDAELAEDVAKRTSLLVLDNLEHLLPEVAPLVAALADSVRVLATSRTGLAIPGEQRVTLDPLEAEPAVCLLQELATLRGVALTDADADALRTIAVRVGGLPLGLELAAARLAVLSPKDLADWLGRSMDVLDTVEGRTLRSVVERSWALLDDTLKIAAAVLSVFPGSFDLDAARAALGRDPLAAVQALLDASFLRVEGGASRRLSIHPAIRPLLAERVEAHDQVEARIVGFYAQGASERTKASTGLDWLRCERENLLSAWERASTEDRLRMAAATNRLLLVDGPAELHERFLTTWAAAASGRGPAAEAESLLARAVWTRVEAQPEHALELLARAQDLAREAGDGQLKFNSLYASGQTYLDLDDPDRARELLEEAEQYAIGYPGAHAMSLCLRSQIALQQDDGATAESLIDRAEVLARERGGVSWFMVSLGRAEIERSRGRTAYALDLMQNARDAAGTNRYHQLLVAQGLAEVHLDLEQHEAALSEVRAGMGLADSRASGRQRMELALIEGRIALDRGLPDEAERALSGASDIRVRGISSAARRAHFARLALAREAWEKACVLAQEAIHEAGDSARLRFTGGLPLAVAKAHLGADATAILAEAARCRTLFSAVHGAQALEIVQAIASHDVSTRSNLLARFKTPLPGEARSWWQSSSEVRFWGRILGRLTAAPERTVLEVGPNAIWFRIAGGEPVDLQRYPTLRRVFDRLLQAHATGSVVDTYALIEAGWPGQKIRTESAHNRLYVAISKLRKRGLDAILETTPEGYCFRADVEVRPTA